MNCRQEVVDAIPCRRPHADSTWPVASCRESAYESDHRQPNTDPANTVIRISKALSTMTVQETPQPSPVVPEQCHAERSRSAAKRNSGGVEASLPWNKLSRIGIPRSVRNDT